MPNMSYCRFRNTLVDLRDCESNLENDDLSYDEYCAKRLLIELCVRVTKRYGDQIVDPALPSRQEYDTRRSTGSVE